MDGIKNYDEWSRIPYSISRAEPGRGYPDLRTDAWRHFQATQDELNAWFPEFAGKLLVPDDPAPELEVVY